MKKKIYETPLLTLDEMAGLGILCASDGVENGTNEGVEFENWD